MRQKQCAVLPHPHTGQYDLWRYNGKILIVLQELAYLGFIFVMIHRTGRIHLTAVRGKIFCAVLQDFLLC